MDDILVPLTEELGVRYVPSVGFQSITNAIRLLQRARQLGKPARAFYISDYDKAGHKMPVAVSRQVEFWMARFAPDADIQLIPLVLTEEQTEKYNLPKSLDGEDNVELDALEALHPGELENIVRRAVEPYVDQNIDRKLHTAHAEAYWSVRDKWTALTAPHKKELTKLQKTVRAMTKKYQKEVAAISKRLQRDLAPSRKQLAKLERKVKHCWDEFDPELPPRPEPDDAEPARTDILFDSSRPYDEQLKHYKLRSRRNGHG